MESLQGNFLVATNKMGDPRFFKSVILVCVHDETDGAMGLIVNQPFADFSMNDVFDNFEIKVDAPDFPPVFYGGPVDVESAFILHGDDYESALSQQVMDKVWICRDPNFLHDVANGHGPEQYFFALGYAGWGPGQLEQELSGEGWLALPAEAQDLFCTPARTLWREVTAKHGININLYSDISGNA